MLSCPGRRGAPRMPNIAIPEEHPDNPIAMPPPPLPLRSKPVSPAPGTQPGAAPPAHTRNAIASSSRSSRMRRRRSESMPLRARSAGRAAAQARSPACDAGAHRKISRPIRTRWSRGCWRRAGKVEADAFDLTLDRLSANRRGRRIVPGACAPAALCAAAGDRRGDGPA